MTKNKKPRNQRTKELNLFSPWGPCALDSLNLFDNFCAAYLVIYFSYVRNGFKYIYICVSNIAYTEE